MFLKVEVHFLLCLLLLKDKTEFVQSQKENGKLIRVKLTRIPPRIHVNYIDVQEYPEEKHCPKEGIFESKYELSRPLMSPNLPEDIFNHEPLSYSYYQTDWYGYMGLGTPPQFFKTIFATNSQLTLVPSVQCITSQCLCKGYFMRSRSSTYRTDNITIDKSTYKSHLLRGQYAFDHITIGLDPSEEGDEKTSGKVIKNIFFAELYDHLPGADYDIHDAVLGLHIFNWPYNNPAVQMFNQRHLTDLKISHYLEQDEGYGNGGEIIFGGVDYSKISGNISYINFIHQNDIKIRMFGIEIYKENILLGIVCRSGCKAKVDTGTKSIHGPVAEVAKINELTGAVRISPSFTIFPNCDLNEMPDIAFHIDGTRYIVSPKQYVIQYEVPLKRTVCVSGIEEVNSKQWTLGQVFLQNFYTVYDYFNHRIGFAERRKSFKKSLVLY